MTVRQKDILGTIVCACLIAAAVSRVNGMVFMPMFTLGVAAVIATLLTLDE